MSQLFIPGVQIYALSDTIPFHLQLRGHAQSLRTFMGEPDDCLPTRVTSRSSSTSSTVSLSPSQLSWAGVRHPTIFSSLLQQQLSRSSGSEKPVIRVYLLRQVAAKVHGQKAWRNVVLGEGKLSPLERPPSWSPSAAEQRGGEDDYAMDWEGEVRCNSDVTNGSFTSGDLQVKVRWLLIFMPNLG